MEEKEDQLTLKGLYVQLFVRLKNLIITPSEEWKIIHSENKDINDILSAYSFPLIGLCTLSTFISILINLQEINFVIAIKHALITFIALSGGLYLAYKAIKHMLPTFKASASNTLTFSLVAYPLTPLLIVTVLVNLFPELILLYLVSFYAWYITWCGTKGLQGINSDSALTISTIITLLIHFLPFFVQRLLLKLIFIL